VGVEAESLELDVLQVYLDLGVDGLIEAAVVKVVRVKVGGSEHVVVDLERKCADATLFDARSGDEAKER
jgi:hypothetical protein